MYDSVENLIKSGFIASTAFLLSTRLGTLSEDSRLVKMTFSSQMHVDCFLTLYNLLVLTEIINNLF